MFDSNLKQISTAFDGQFEQEDSDWFLIIKSLSNG